MQMRKSFVAALAAFAVSLTAAFATAETLQDENALRLERGAVIATQMNVVGRQAAADSAVMKAVDQEAQADVLNVRGPGGHPGGHHPGGHPGGHHPGGHNPGGHHGGWHPHHGHHDGWHHHPGHGGHYWPHYHSGWGHHHRWGWVGVYPLWPIWVTIPIWYYTVQHPNCVNYYAGYYNSCVAAAAQDASYCRSTCWAGDFDCNQQCDYHETLARERCAVDYAERRHNVCHVP